MKKCLKCNNIHNNKGLYCSRKCSNSRKWKKEDKKKISDGVNSYLKSIGKNIPEIKICKECKKEFKPKKTKIVFCSVSCAAKDRWKNKEYRKNITEQNIKRCSIEEERNRLRNIGKKGGFGKKGYTNKGIYYQSTNEKQIYEWLDKNNIIYEPHKNLPNCSKISDLYIPQINYWIEIDGINREKNKKWLKKDYKYWVDKLNEYRKNDLNLLIVLSFKEFVEKINKLIGD